MSAVTDTIRNGVDTEKLFATLDLIRAQPELAQFQFRASNRWIEGAHNRSTIKGFYADEVLRVIDSLQLTAEHKVATPVNWQQGEDVIVAGSVSDDEARETYPDGWESPRPYVRFVPQPR